MVSTALVACNDTTGEVKETENNSAASARKFGCKLVGAGCKNTATALPFFNFF